MRVVILSGGSGTRLWPLSNAVQSKQFLCVLDGPNGEKESMLQRVYRQLKTAGIEKNRISVVTGHEQADYIRRQVGSETVLIEEPERRNTFPAIALAALHLAECQQVSRDEPVIVMPADVYAEQGYFDLFGRMAALCSEDAAGIVLMGIRPERPSDQFGYIVPEQTPGPHGAMKVHHFEEKPSVSRAEELINRGALWNGGVFAFKLGWLLERLEGIAPGLRYAGLVGNYAALEKTSFDYAVVEKVSDLAVVPYAGQWMDLGTWKTLCSKMADTVTGKVAGSWKSDGSTIINELPVPVAVVGVPNAVVCAAWDGILVLDKDESDHLKDCLDIPEAGPMYEQRLWGEYSVLQNTETDDGRRALTKYVTVTDGESTDYRKYRHRDEIWTIVSGEGEVTLDEETFRVRTGDTVRIPAGTRHSVKSFHDLHIVEVQIGEDIPEEDA